MVNIRRWLKRALQTEKELEELRRRRAEAAETTFPKYTETLEAAIRKLDMERTAVLTAIQRIEKPVVRRVLEMKYLQGLTIEEICGEIHYGRRQISRFLEEGIAGIEKDGVECHTDVGV